ncbi:hypothetical protein CC1G_12125 [Coprinopsis cinerea okayama7|uniref:MYND-type domain-containing protein n=1 Tax=Coprinopsis cinerea (strain Okayama-7 / 130 / ATCC MYA-4618 / FGSC 9003) TaxID=240176 RepID=A8PAY4_COPC7|nr:hypothetical protein CC1G_12125 [Coprinopsis cinerea okayama7\|eukprot:XP_001840071.1 hypothetical protein CC1G_12125 [Coprinopsis cinerea okayama7\
MLTITKTLLPHLLAPFPKTIQTAAGKAVFDRASFAYDMFTVFFDGEKRSGVVGRLATARRLALEYLEPLLSWKRFAVLNNEGSVGDLLSFVHLMLTEGDDLSMAALSSPCTIDCLITAATTTNDYEENLETLPFPEGLLLVLHKCLVHDVSRAIFFDKLFSLRPAVIQVFVSKVVSLLDYLYTMIRNVPPGTQPPVDLMHFVNDINDIFEYLSMDRRLARYLLKENYIEGFLVLVLFQFPKLKEWSEDDYFEPFFLESILSVFVWANHHRSASNSIVADLIVRRPLKAVFDMLTKIRRAGQAKTKADDVLNSVIGHLTSKRALAFATADTRNHPMVKMSTRNHAGVESFGDFVQVLNLHRLSFQTPYPKRLVLCQNIGHLDRGFRAPSQGEGVRQCSRCRSVVYCSEACQKQDWERLHKRECKAMAQAVSVLKHERAWVPWHIRQRSLFVFSEVQKTLNRSEALAHMKSFARQRAGGIQNLKRVISGVRVELCPVNELQTVDEYRKSGQHFLPQAETRFENLVAHTQTRENVWLFEAEFPFGDCKVHYLCLVDEDSGASSNFGGRLLNGMVQIE